MKDPAVSTYEISVNDPNLFRLRFPHHAESSLEVVAMIVNDVFLHEYLKRGSFLSNSVTPIGFARSVFFPIVSHPFSFLVTLPELFLKISAAIHTDGVVT